jgi:hypothetical protein
MKQLTHPEDEDIARFIDGNVNKHEREEFLKHFSECDACLKAYAETLKFVEEEEAEKKEKGKYLLRFPKVLPGKFGSIFGGFSWKPVAAAVSAVLLVIFLLVPLVRKKGPGDEVLSTKIQYIEDSIMKMEDTENYAFSSSIDKNKVNAAVRAGFFIEDLYVLFQANQKEELKTKIIGKCVKELKFIFADEPGSPSAGLETIKKENFKRVVKKMQEGLEQQALFESFQLGRFVEGSILSGFENKRPGKKELERYLVIAEKNNLPPGVVKDFERLKNTGDVIENREICRDIKEVFLGTR